MIAALSRRLAMGVMLALAGCPQHTPPEPPRDPPPTVGGGGPGLQTPEPAVSGSEGAAEGPGAGPALSAPGGGEGIADVLAPRASEREARGGDCQDGARQAGESWRVDCNTCSCGDDGQVTCTVLACGAPRG